MATRETVMRFLQRLLVLGVIFGLSGCANLWPHIEERQGRSSSLVEFLYPSGEIPSKARERIPELELPLRVGLAFLPSAGRDQVSPVEQQRVLDRSSAEFASREYIEHIEVIPQAYIQRVNGATGLSQMGRMINVDVVALVAYDQIASSEVRDSALLYWTVVGAYLVKGNEHEVQTFVDIAVVDVATATLLMRAPGTAQSKANATLSDSRRDLAQRRSDSFVVATDELMLNLDAELELFEQRVKQSDGSDMVVTTRAGYSFGGGALNIGLLLGLVLLVRRRAHS